MGDVTTVDYHQQQGNQYLVNTHSFIYLFNSTGADVGNYTFSFTCKASAGLSIIKGSSLNDTRFYIPCRNFSFFMGIT